jgi:hypothetical protein
LLILLKHIGMVCSVLLSAVLLWRTGNAQPVPSDKNIWDYSGGVSLITNGSLPNGACFRVQGRVTAPGFFDNLKRIDTKQGTVFRRGSEVVTRFPAQLVLVFVVHDQRDFTCPKPPEGEGAAPYLTHQMMSTLKLFMYWKHGVELRPIANVQQKYFSVDPIIPYAAMKAHDLPERLEWSYEYVVPSADVPLSDSLVLVLRTADGRMAARVAARL